MSKKFFNTVQLIVVLVVGITTLSFGQDYVKKANGPLLEVKIEEIGSTDITYKLTNNLNGPTYRAKLTVLDWIKIKGENDTMFLKAKPAVQKIVAAPAPLKVESVPAPMGGNLKVITRIEDAKDQKDVYYDAHTDQLVILPDSLQPFMKEIFFSVGGGTTTPLGNFGSNTGNFYSSDGGGYAGLGGFFEIGLTARMKKNWGGFLQFKSIFNGVNINEMGMEYTNPMDRNLKNNYIENSTQIRNFAIIGGPTYFLKLNRRTDLMLQAGLGLGSGYTTDIYVRYSNSNVIGSTRQNEEYRTSEQSTIGVGYLAAARLKIYLINNFYLIGNFEYNGFAVSNSWVRWSESDPGRSKNYVVSRNYENFLLGMSLGFGF
jgi:hypothetical protein